MKVLHLLASNQFSGAENVVCQIINMMNNEPNIAMLYCCPDGPIREALHVRNISYVSITALTVSEIKRVVKENRPDIVHAHDMRASFMASLACGECALISHIHNNAFDSRHLSIKSMAYFFAARKANHIFWVSESAYKDFIFKRVFAKKSEVLRNIIDTEGLYERMRLDHNTYDYDIIYVGRLTYPKNPERLIRVCAGVVAQKPDATIAIVGTGELETEAKSLCHELKLDKNITFLGFQSNPLKILRDSKVMLMTSRWEGTPMCALEAMALGVPIVSTPTDGLKNLIEDGVSGYLCDNDSEMIKKTLDLLLNSRLRAVFSERNVVKSREENRSEIYREKLLQAYSKRR